MMVMAMQPTFTELLLGAGHTCQEFNISLDTNFFHVILTVALWGTVFVAQMVFGGPKQFDKLHKPHN